MTNRDADNREGQIAEPYKKKRQRHSDNWGGAREGAGRLPNEVPSVWLQLGVMLSEEEYEFLSTLGLSPGQRRHRLLNPNPDPERDPTNGWGTPVPSERAYTWNRSETSSSTGTAGRRSAYGTVLESINDTGVERRQYNVRVVLESPSSEYFDASTAPLEQRRQILMLDQDERRRRLLIEPGGGDIEDERPGKWRTERKGKRDAPEGM